MIKVKYNDDIIKISGHANFDNFGKDIVCASVSSIVYTTINAILNFNSKAIKYDDNKDIIINIIKKDEITRKLIDNMLTLLEELHKQYPDNIKISKGE